MTEQGELMIINSANLLKDIFFFILMMERNNLYSLFFPLYFISHLLPMNEGTGECGRGN